MGVSFNCQAHYKRFHATAAGELRSQKGTTASQLGMKFLHTYDSYMSTDVKNKTLILYPSFYYAKQESDVPDKDKDGVFIGKKSELLYRSSKEFQRLAEIEGTAILNDGRTLNVWKRINGQMRWFETEHPYGVGSKGQPLRPYKTIAISQTNTVINIGDQIYIDKVKGMPLPGGGCHDGIFEVIDTFGKSEKREDRVDMFCAAGSLSVKTFKGYLEHMVPFTAMLLDENGLEGAKPKMPNPDELIEDLPEDVGENHHHDTLPEDGKPKPPTDHNHECEDMEVEVEDATVGQLLMAILLRLFGLRTKPEKDETIQ